jgi:iron complex transport system substrate-binding protein
MRFLTAIVLLFGVLLAACGGSDSSSSKPASGGSTSSSAAPATAAATSAPVAKAETDPVLPVTVQDKDGKNVTIKDVKRIIPLNGDIAEVVVALGLQKNIVGVDTSATYPAELKSLPSIGYQRTLAAEGIISLNPSVIIGNDQAGPPEVIEQIRGLGVPVLLIKDVTTIEGVQTKIKQIGAALGVPNRAGDLAKSTQKQIDDAMAKAAQAKDKTRVVFLYLRGTSTQLILGEGSRGDVMLKAAGAVDVGVEAGIKGTKPITPEALASARPDVILVLTAGLQSVGSVDGLLKIPGIAQTPAGQNKRVVDLDDQYLLGLGPRTGQAIMDLVKKLHPELS